MQQALRTRPAPVTIPPISRKRKREEEPLAQVPLRENPISLFSPRNNPDIKLSRSRTASYDKFIGTLNEVFIDDGYISEDFSWLKSTPSPVHSRSDAIQKYIQATNPKYEDSPRPSNIVKDFFNFGVHVLNLT
jgi:hypothetical protein